MRGWSPCAGSRGKQVYRSHGPQPHRCPFRLTQATDSEIWVCVPSAVTAFDLAQNTGSDRLTRADLARSMLDQGDFCYADFFDG